MQRRQRQPNETAALVMPLLILGMTLIASDRFITYIDDETSILGAATQPVRATLSLYWSGEGQHEHPPLFDILLHFWLRLTGGAFEYLRLPSIVFFLVGLFLLACAAKRLGGKSSALATVWLGVLWPFGFHYGRLAAWYSFSFFLVAGLTLAYLKYLEDPKTGQWAWFCLLGVALLWTNYFGWAVLGCFAIDQFLRHRASERTANRAVVLQTISVWCVAFLPLLRAFRTELGMGLNFHVRPLAILANSAFSFYSLFVSEAVAPWFWVLSIPAGLAVLVCVVLVVISIPKNARRFLLYGFLLFAVMAVSGLLLTKRLLLVAPWIVMAIGIAIAESKPLYARIGLPVALLIIGGIGWYGIYTRRYYSAPRFIEPWPKIAQETVDKIHGGAMVIADNPSFLFYLTYTLPAPQSSSPWKFLGLLPEQILDPHVKFPEQWLAAGHPISPAMVWIRGVGGARTVEPMDASADQLGRSCGAQTSRMTMRDSGYEWKKRIFPEAVELQWRIEVRDYDCTSTESQQIFQFPIR
jgi:dolichyl-phosphate-mannose-protein mannosyltransferase